jgi:hypothetical protein
LLEQATAIGNISPQEKQQRIDRTLEEFSSDQAALDSIANQRASELEATYERLKPTMGGGKVTVTPYPPDLLGVYVLLPGGKA